MNDIKGYILERLKEFGSIVVVGDKDSILKVARAFGLEDEIIRRQRSYKLPFLQLPIEYDGHKILLISNDKIPNTGIYIMPYNTYGDGKYEFKKEEDKGTGWGDTDIIHIGNTSNINTQE